MTKKKTTLTDEAITKLEKVERDLAKKPGMGLAATEIASALKLLRYENKQNAAAPDLLAALKTLTHKGDVSVEDYKAARAAIAKAGVR